MQRTWTIPILAIALVVVTALIMMERLAGAAPTRDRRIIALSELENRGYDATFVMPCNYTKQFPKIDVYLYYKKPNTEPPETVQYSDDLEYVELAEAVFFGKAKKDTILLRANPDVKNRDGMTLSHIEINFPINQRLCDGAMFETLTR